MYKALILISIKIIKPLPSAENGAQCHAGRTSSASLDSQILPYGARLSMDHTCPRLVKGGLSFLVPFPPSCRMLTN